MDKGGAGCKGAEKPLQVAIVGGGLVGSLAALFFARRGAEVHLYEYREDIRLTPHVRGRSINLSLSTRGRTALRAVGLEQTLYNHGLPMRGRMIHSLSGATNVIPYDRRTNQSIFSVGRRFLNEVLLSETDKYCNVHLHFNHKLVDAQLHQGELTFLLTKEGSTLDVKADLVVGADGAFSTVRKHMMKEPLFDFSQKYIEHGYMELCIPPDAHSEFAMPHTFLHIWPRGEFMMIALPNQDKTWTVTLFMPFVKFKILNTTDALLKFFYSNFPDAVPLIGETKLIEDFFKAKPLPLVSVKCRPYHVADRAVLLGDAAHAMVPFYGQGMNAGFEDCFILDRLFNRAGVDGTVQRVLEDFSDQRAKDAHAICDLALYNYVEMRDLVTRRSYRLRKRMDDLLFKLFPATWIPLYNSVTFSDMRYSQCVANRKWQNKVFARVLYFVLAVLFLGVPLYAFCPPNSPRLLKPAAAMKMIDL